MIEKIMIILKREGDLTALLLKSDGNQYAEARKEVTLVKNESKTPKFNIRQALSFMEKDRPTIFLLCRFNELPEEIQFGINGYGLDSISLMTLTKYANPSLQLSTNKLLDFCGNSNWLKHECLTFKNEQNTYKLYDRMKELSAIHQAEQLKDYDLLIEIVQNDLNIYISKKEHIKVEIRKAKDTIKALREKNTVVISRTQRLETIMDFK
jgi:hypothetical protein